MDRRGRRAHRRKIRRIGIAVASVAMLGTTLGLTGVAAANGSGGRYDQCSPGPNSYGGPHSGWTNYDTGRAGNACDEDVEHQTED
jgi:hypothetical protein